MNTQNKNLTFIVLVGLFFLLFSSQDSFAATAKGMIVYIRVNNAGTPEYEPMIPAYRLWDGAGWSGEKNALAVSTATSGTIKWVVLKQCPIKNEYILGTLDSENKVRVQVYNGDTDTWHDKQEISTVSNSNCRGFDIAYEFFSGQAVVTASNGTTLPAASKPVYYYWSGSVWNGPYTLNITASPTYTTGIPLWIRLKPWPMSYSGANDIIMLGLLDSNKNYYYVSWRGNLWWTSTGAKMISADAVPVTRIAYTATLAEPLDFVTFYPQYTCPSCATCTTAPFNLGHNYGTACSLVRYTEFLSGSYYEPFVREYRASSPASWGPEFINGIPSTAHPYWIRAANRVFKKGVPATFNSLAAFAYSGKTLYLNLLRENADCTKLGLLYTLTNVATVTTRCFDVAMESNQMQGILVKGTAATNTIYYVLADLSGAGSAAVGTGPNVGGVPAFVTLSADAGSDDIMLAVINSNANKQLYAVRWNGSTNTWAAIGSPLTSSAYLTTATPCEPVAVAFQSYLPPLKLSQFQYRWFANADSVQPGAAMAGENTAIENVPSGTVLRLRMNVRVTDADLNAPQKFALEYSASTSGPWQRVSVSGAGKIWRSQTVDTTTGASEIDFPYCEMDMDSSGNPRIAYEDMLNERIKYAKWNAALNNWEIETVPTGYSVFYGYPNIVLEKGNDNPHLAYTCDYDEDGLFDLGYCKKVAGSWEKMEGGKLKVAMPDTSAINGTIGYRATLALDSSGKPHLIHMDGAYLAYTRSDDGGTTWRAEQVIDAVSAVGVWVAMVIDSANTIHIAYSNVGSGTMYLKGNGTTWNPPITIDSAGVNAVSITVDKNNYPHILRGGVSELKYYRWNGSSFDSVDLSGLPLSVGISALSLVSLRLDADDHPHLVYSYSVADTTYGVGYAEYDSGAWRNEVVEESYTTIQGGYPYSLRPRAFGWDTSGIPHVVYSRATSKHYEVREAAKVDPGIIPFYNNTGVPDRDPITGSLLSGSNVLESYAESNPSAGMPNPISTGKSGEWDWVIKTNGLLPNTTYYFRMVKGNGDALDSYDNYPQLKTQNQASKAKMTHWEEIR